MDGADPYETLPTFQFGGGGALADALAALVLRGLKSATCTTLAEYQEKGEAIPTPGERFVMLDSRGVPLGVIETVAIEVQPAGAVDEAFARDEGEGDRTLSYWRQAHKRYFAGQGRALTNETLLVCERFKLVHIFAADLEGSH